MSHHACDVTSACRASPDKVLLSMSLARLIDWHRIEVYDV